MTTMLTMRITPEEREALRHDAHQHDMTVSNYLRWLIDRERSGGAPAADPWTDPKIKPPADGEMVQICTRSKNGSMNIDKGYMLNGRWVHRGTAEVIRWMQLPPMPEVD